ncbi:MAG: ectonucleotide pyrophosphatase/phosphodiesterase [Clostridium sp.]|uniref:alkaline phosphatase family protein n=1 Tax=Clostridium sp. TaxID=1506 RepID=UPI002FC5DDAE
MEDRHLILISLDGFSSDDFEYAKTLPNFRSLLLKGSYVLEGESIYPSLTYPAHASVVTGLYPSQHGVVNNTVLDKTSVNKDWLWYRNYIEADTIYDAAKRKGLKTASILWPVSAGANIDYNLTEIWSTKKGENTALKLLKNSSKLYSLDLYFRFNKLRKGIEQPYLDDFVCESAAYTIKTKKPNLFMIHLIDLDTQKHIHGIKSKEVREAINRFDLRIESIVNALKEASIYENTTIVAFGDHSQMDARYKVRPNVMFKEKGLIKTYQNSVAQSKCYFYSCDGSGYVYVEDENVKSKVFNILSEYKGKGVIESIFEGDNPNKESANTSCTFMIEASKGYYFTDDLEGLIVEDMEKYIGVHGYSPLIDKYTSPIIFSGRGIKEGKVIKKGMLVDIAGTVSKILDININNESIGCINEVLDL